MAGISVASAVVARSRFRTGFIGGIMCALLLFTWFFVFVFEWEGGAPLRWMGAPAALLAVSGTTSWLAAALVNVLTSKSRYVGFTTGALVNPMGIVLLVHTFTNSLSPWLGLAVKFSGLGIAVGAMAGLATAVERRSQGNTLRGIGARSSAGTQE